MYTHRGILSLKKENLLLVKSWMELENSMLSKLSQAQKKIPIFSQVEPKTTDFKK